MGDLPKEADAAIDDIHGNNSLLYMLYVAPTCDEEMKSYLEV